MWPARICLDCRAHLKLKQQLFKLQTWTQGKDKEVAGSFLPLIRENMSGVCSFHIHEPTDRWHHFWKHGLHTIPWRSLIDKLDSREPRANQCKSLVCNNTRQARQRSFFKVMVCQEIGVQQQAQPGNLLAGCWLSPMAWGWGLYSPVSMLRTWLWCYMQEPEPCIYNSFPFLCRRHHNFWPLLSWQQPPQSHIPGVHMLLLIDVSETLTLHLPQPCNLK